jgi:type II secretory pathway component GspD/PulD (secretin)
MNPYTSLVLLCTLAATAVLAADEAGPPEAAPENPPTPVLARALESLQRPLILEALETPVGTPLDEEAERVRLTNLPAVRIPVQEASLGSAVTLIAAAAGMNFIAPPPDEFPESVSIFVTASPWGLLETLSRQYGFTMTYGGGVWVFVREAAGALSGTTYPLRHTNLDTFEASQNSLSVMPQAGAEGGGAGAGSAGGTVFTSRTDRIVRDVRDLLGMAAVGTEASAGQATGGSRVVHLPETNSILVIATRAQHEHVRAYLAQIDRPARQVRIEARFVETSRDPREVIGVDPSGFQPNLRLSDLSSTVDLNRIGSVRLPGQAVLSADSVSLQLNALRTDERSRIVNEPTVTTMDNREVCLSVGTEEPFASATLTGTGEAGVALGTSQSSVAFRRIGTTMNVLPTVFEGEAGGRPMVRLAVQVEVGSLAGFRRIAGSDVPRVQSQRYTFTVIVAEGETLAFGGLAGVAEVSGERSVPGLSRIPVAGALFRSRSKQDMQRNLIAYITPRVVAP